MQIREDFAGDFEVRARVHNTGGGVQGVVWTVTLFSGGNVVGTAQTSASGLAAGSTTTQTFTSLDDFVEGVDAFEFQVDTEF